MPSPSHTTADGSPATTRPDATTTAVPASDALARARGFLDRTLDGTFPPAELSWGREFHEIIAPHQARRTVLDRTGVDLGFDPGEEAFTAMLALALTPWLPEPLGAAVAARTIPIVTACRQGERFRFFRHDGPFAADTDCTGVATAGLYARHALTVEELRRTAAELELAAAPGPTPERGAADDHDLHQDVLMVYWEDGRQPSAASRGRKHDAVACANALNTVALGWEAARHTPGPATWASLRYLRDHLQHGHYLAGTRYYPDPDAFLYAASRFADRPHQAFHTQLRQPLGEALEHLEGPASLHRSETLPAPALAQRILTARALQLTAHQHERRHLLLHLQGADGSWPPGPLFRTGRIPLFYGSATVSTLLAVAALTHTPTPAAPVGVPRRPAP